MLETFDEESELALCEISVEIQGRPLKRKRGGAFFSAAPEVKGFDWAGQNGKMMDIMAKSNGLPKVNCS